MVPLILQRRQLVGLAGLGLLALVVRLAIALTVPDHGPVSDMFEYWERAVFIAEHGRLYENSWRMPGLPGVLAFAFWLASGSSVIAARMVNVAAGVATTGLTYWLARRTAGVRTSLIAALLIAMYPSFLIYTTYVATANVVAVPLLGALIAATYATMPAVLAAGACAGVATLVRPVGLAIVPAMLWSFAHPRVFGNAIHNRFVHTGLFTIVLVLVMTPWWLHNANQHGRFVPLDTTGGYNLLIGNGPYATGQWHWNDVSRLHSEYLRDVDVSTPVGSDAAMRVALAHMRAHPVTTMKLVPTKIAALFAVDGREHMALYSSGYFGPLSSGAVWIWGVLIIAAFPLLLAAALAGCTVRGGIDPRVLHPCVGFLIAAVTLQVFTFGDPRFHLPLSPVLAVLSTGLARWRHGVHPLRVAVAAMFLVWLAGPWSRQIAAYSAALVRMTAPDGWQSTLPFIDLR